ncbi:MAG TPA: hypothetical protein VHB51_01990 [Candidatus Saccharimonadales bacterium]|nr:hypothetical protein [Candidatus Saccharimonadales bacterium]
MKSPHNSLVEAYKRGHDVNYVIARALLQVEHRPAAVDSYEVTITAVSETGDEDLSLDILRSCLTARSRAFPEAVQVSDSVPLSARVSGDVLSELGAVAFIMQPAAELVTAA